MNYSIKYSQSALNDLNEIAGYIVQESRSYDMAFAFVDELQKTVDILKDFPKSGMLPKDRFLLKFNYRFLVHGNYLIFYKEFEMEKAITIVAVFNAKKDYVRMMKNYL